jgi:hypothetical protein
VGLSTRPLLSRRNCWWVRTDVLGQPVIGHAMTPPQSNHIPPPCQVCHQKNYCNGVYTYRTLQSPLRRRKNTAEEAPPGICSLGQHEKPRLTPRAFHWQSVAFYLKRAEKLSLFRKTGCTAPKPRTFVFLVQITSARKQVSSRHRRRNVYIPISLTPSQIVV